MMVSPTEPALLRAAGTTNLMPESYGADILIRPHKNFGLGWIGVQRKEVADLMASIMDGRLNQQIAQLNQCLLGFVVIEGKMRWTLDGEAVSAWGTTVTRDAIDSLIFSIMSRGVHVAYTDDLRGTVEWCQKLEAWAKKPEHKSLDGRPGPVGDAWGRVTNRAWARHLLLGFQGIGVKTADAIIDHFGRVPLDWGVTEAEMKMVKGLGVKRVRMMFDALKAGDDDDG
jgi:ERCC4-type nuclease